MVSELNRTEETEQTWQGLREKHTSEGGNKAQINLIVIVIKAGSVCVCGGGGNKSSKESSEKLTFKIKQEVKWSDFKK